MAFTVSNEQHFRVGNMMGWLAKIYGDGADVTLVVPMSHVAFYITSNIDEADGYSPAISVSGNTLTYATAPTSTKYHWVLVLGFN
jgi:hypothetical protein